MVASPDPAVPATVGTVNTGVYSSRFAQPRSPATPRGPVRRYAPRSPSLMRTADTPAAIARSARRATSAKVACLMICSPPPVPARRENSFLSSM